MNKRRFLEFTALQSALAVLPQVAFGQTARDLRLALTVAPAALDPHFADVFTSTQGLLQIYQPLLGQDEKGQLIPYLATSWKALDDTTWEIKLREGVKFHDGTPFEPEDIAFSFQRVPNVPGAIAPFTANVRDVKSVEVVGPNTVHIKTGSPDPLYAYKLCQVCMLSRKLHANVTTADFNSGKAAIGTGPYRLVSFAPGERMELAANPTYWGGKPDWDKVSIRYVVDAGARIAALRAGEVDLIDNVPVQDVADLQADKKIALFSSPAFLTVYMMIDSARAVSPFVTDLNGKPLERNPLQDPRVRRALSLSVDRGSIVSRLMAGQANVPDQMVGLPVVDRAPDMPPLKTDLAEARELLKAAGYPQGFKLTLHGPNGWFPNDAKILQAVAQGFSRIGVRTDVEVLPPAVLQTRSRDQNFSIALAAFNGPFALITLRFVTMTNNPAAGNGTSNWSRYSNAKLDQAMLQALKTMDPEKRRILTSAAMRELIADMGVIPVIYTKPNWAGRRDKVRYTGNPMSRTSAFYAKPV